MLKIVDDFCWNAHASELISRIIRLIHRRLIFYDDFLQCWQLLEKFAQSINSWWHDDVRGKNIFQVFDDIAVFLQAIKCNLQVT